MSTSAIRAIGSPNNWHGQYIKPDGYPSGEGYYFYALCKEGYPLHGQVCPLTPDTAEYANWLYLYDPNARTFGVYRYDLHPHSDEHAHFEEVLTWSMNIEFDVEDYEFWRLLDSAGKSARIGMTLTTYITSTGKEADLAGVQRRLASRLNATATGV